MEYNSIGKLQGFSFPFLIEGLKGIEGHPLKSPYANFYTIDDYEAYPLEGIHEIKIDGKKSSINIFTHPEDDIKMQLRGRIQSSLPYITPSLLVNSINGIFNGTIKDYDPMVLPSDEKLHLDIYIPVGYQRNLIIENPYGSLIINDNIQVNSFSYNSINGSLKGKSIHAKETYVKTITGEIDLEDIVGDMILETVTGDISIGLEENKKNVSIKTVTGNCRVKGHYPYPQCQFKTVTGKITKSKEILEGKTGNYPEFTIETVIGHINVF